MCEQSLLWTSDLIIAWDGFNISPNLSGDCYTLPVKSEHPMLIFRGREGVGGNAIYI